MLKKKSKAEYASEEEITFFYLVIHKKDKDSDTHCSIPFSSREDALKSKFYKDNRYKRIIRIEARDSWLKQL